ncbi:hypothetical protein FRC08_004514 [Ceratobasidium sp. 394]|nr:hypothetical protein FRC08_004514 [Ceratobasidium sp. 394]KAG9083085.1 hypothetical protein FS749_006313 [Ceratobasidium sp. UAMH 11750]
MHGLTLSPILITHISDADVARDYAWMCCEEFGLIDADREDVVQALQMHNHLIALRSYTRITSLTRNVQRMIVDSFLSTTEFKDHITRRVQAILLDPSLSAYVCGLTDRLVKHMQLHPNIWHIPPVVQANFLHTKLSSRPLWRWRVISVAICTGRQLKKSIVQKCDIITLAEQLCIKGYQPEREHLKRYHEDWLKLPSIRGKRQTSFWEFIDSKLEKLRTVCTRSTTAETHAAIKHKLKLALDEDKLEFPGNFDLPTKSSLSA